MTEQKIYAFWRRLWLFSQFPEIFDPLMEEMSDADKAGDPAGVARARRRFEEALDELERREP